MTTNTGLRPMASQQCTRRGLLLSAALAALWPPALRAQGFDARSLRLVCPFGPGASLDYLSRLVAKRTTEAGHGPAVVENQTGAGGLVALESVARAPADGASVLVGTSGPIVLLPLMQPQLVKVDPAQALTPLCLMAVQKQVLAVRADFPARSVQDLIAHARSTQAPLSFGSPGLGTTPHLAGELFNRMAGLDIVHVPYRGSAASLLDLVSGQLPMVYTDIASILPHVKDGRVRLLGSTSAEPPQSLPNLPSIASQGMPGFDTSSWYGLFVHTATPAAIKSDLARKFSAVLAQPEVVAGILEKGMEPLNLQLDAASAFIARDRARWKRVLAQLDLPR